MNELYMNSLLVTLFLNELELICLHTVKWFQMLPSNSNCSYLQTIKCFLVLFILVILFHINHLFVHCKMIFCITIGR